MGDADEWTAFFERVKKRPGDFYKKCVDLLTEQDIYEPGDLADLDFDMFKGQLETRNTTAGQRTFLELAADQAKAEKLQKEKLGDNFEPIALNPRNSLQNFIADVPASSSNASLPTPVLAAPAAAAPDRIATRRARAPVPVTTASSGAANAEEEDDEAESAEPGTPVAALVLPGTEDPTEIMRRGGIEINWTGKDGSSRRVTKYRETKMRHIVDQDLALPNLYLHFLDKGFFVKECEYNLSLRAGNDNSEIQLVLPEAMVPRRDAVPECWRSSLDTVMRVLRSQCEVMSSSVDEKPGSFGPKKNLKATIHTQRLYFSLRTARPKSAINLDKVAFGIPGDAELYLFAENHVGVNYMSKRDTDAFEKCIEESLSGGDDFAKFGVFLKVFYEGGFAYNLKIPMGKGYLPKTVGIACMSVIPAFDGQSGIATGYPYLLESRFLPFIDTVPVTIRAITEMSARHARYGLCFTRCVFVWESEALEREGVLNFCSIVPHGGFYYCSSTLRKHWKLGGLIYSFGEAKDSLEAPVAVDSSEAAAAGAPPGLAGGGTAAPAADQLVCVICLSADAVFATVPCGHRAFCGGCQEHAKRRNCPVCRTFVSDVMRIY